MVKVSSSGIMFLTF